MSGFDKIREQIAKELADKPTPVASKPTATVDDKGMPDLSQRVGPIGTIASKPGTEKVILDASTFQFMECVAAGASTDKKIRYCIVEKGKTAVYGNQYINSAGVRTHIVTRDVYNLMLGVITSASGQIKNLSRELASAVELKDTYKLTIDALRKNGVID